jgi:hypothetical protein
MILAKFWLDRLICLASAACVMCYAQRAWIIDSLQ